jgi:hypothetical protein
MTAIWIVLMWFSVATRSRGKGRSRRRERLHPAFNV